MELIIQLVGWLLGCLFVKLVFFVSLLQNRLWHGLPGVLHVCLHSGAI